MAFQYYAWEEFDDFLAGIPKQDAAKLMSTISKIEEFGLLIASREKWVRKLEPNLYEKSKKVVNERDYSSSERMKINDSNW